MGKCNEHGVYEGFCPDCTRQKINKRNSAGCSNAAQETATNIRRNLKHMHRLLHPEEEGHGALIDFVNHIDALAQQIENGI